MAGFAGLFLVLSKDISKYKILGLITIMGILITAPFLIRNFIQSGYLVYPFPSMDIFNVDWKVPLTNAISDKAWIESYALKPGTLLPVDSLNFYERISILWNTISSYNKILYWIVLSLFLLMIVSEFYRFFIRKDRKPRDFICLYPVRLTLLFIIFFWFDNAPNYRFIFATFHFLLALSIATILTNFINFNALRCEKIKYSYKFKNIINILQKLILATLSIIFLIFIITYLFSKPNGIMLSPLLSPDIIEIKHKNIGKYNHSSWQTYNAPLPSGRYPIPDNVYLIGETIKDGFKVKKSK